MLPQASRTFVAPAGQRTGNDWGRLAESLGIAVPLEVPEPVPPAARQAARTEAVEIPPPEKLPASPPMVASEAADAELETIEVTDFLPEGAEIPADLFSSVDTESPTVEAEDRPRRERPEGRRRKRRRRRRGRTMRPLLRRRTAKKWRWSCPRRPRTPEQTEPQEVDDLSEAAAVESGEESLERPRRRRRRRRRRLPAREEEAVEPVEAPLEEPADAVEEPADAVEEPLVLEEVVEEDAETGGDGGVPMAVEETPGDISDLDDDVERACATMGFRPGTRRWGW